MSNHVTESEESRFDKASSATYRKNCEGCGRGYHSALWQAHHVLPGTSLDQGTIWEQIGKDDEKSDFIERCKDVTPWDLNKSHNLIGLPTIWDYIVADWKKKGGKALAESVIPLSDWAKGKIKEGLKNFSASEWPINLPCHNPTSYGHSEYDDEVSQHLTLNVWNRLQQNKKAHKVNPKSIESQLTKAENHFLKQLEARGKRGNPAGTEKNWSRRSPSSNWYEPFSMADSPNNPL